jgi:hypothetical protein
LNIILLSYVNRSGSTYLTNLLSSSGEILGCPESDWIVRELLEDPGAAFQNRPDIAGEVSADPKMKAWKFARDEMQKIPPGLTNIEVFVHLLEIFRRKTKPGANYVVFKAERLAFLYSKINRCGTTGSKFIFFYLYRDPRAVWYSQQRTINPLIFRPFSSDPVRFAQSWRRHIAASLKLSKTMNLHLVRYEELILDLENQCRFLEDELGLARNTLQPGKGDYSQLIPEDHKAIHKSVTLEPLQGKISEWKTNLSQPEISTVEYVSGLRDYNYEPLATPPGIIRAICIQLLISYYNFWHFLKRTIYKLRRFG